MKRSEILRCSAGLNCNTAIHFLCPRDHRIDPEIETLMFIRRAAGKRTSFMGKPAIGGPGRSIPFIPWFNSSLLPSLPSRSPVKMMEEPRSILILQILLILSKNPLCWNFHSWWRTSIFLLLNHQRSILIDPNSLILNTSLHLIDF